MIPESNLNFSDQFYPNRLSNHVYYEEPPEYVDPSSPNPDHMSPCEFNHPLDPIIDHPIHLNIDNETVTFNIGEKKCFTMIDSVTLEIEYDTRIFNYPTLLIKLKDNQIDVPEASLIIEDRSNMQELMNKLENPKTLVEHLRGRGYSAEIIADYIQKRI